MGTGLVWADTNKLTATIDLGAAHKVVAGDRFQILTGYIGYVWNLRITNVFATPSQGVLAPSQPKVNAGVLVPGALAEWLPPGDPRHR